MKTLILFLIFISCSNVEETKHIPQEITTNDTITKIINDERHNRVLNELKSEKLLTELSKQKAIQMELSKQVNHDGFAILNVHTETYGQVVGYGFKSEVSLFNNYMNSEKHKNVILGNYTHIGSYTHKTYNCILFAKY